jgi:hypothetical protein
MMLTNKDIDTIEKKYIDCLKRIDEETPAAIVAEMRKILLDNGRLIVLIKPGKSNDLGDMTEEESSVVPFPSKG